MSTRTSAEGNAVGTWQRGSLALLFAVTAFVLLFPFSGDDFEPTVHHSVFGNEVPSGNPLWALLLGVLVGSMVWMVTPRRRP